MAASARIKAQNIIFKIDGTDYECDANMIELSLGDAPGDVQTFCETRVGGEWALQIDGITSGTSTSLYRILWDNFGTEVPFVIAPNGNTAPVANAPHYEGVAILNELPPLSLNSNETALFSVTLEVKNTPHDPSANQYYGVEIVTA
jgi:hypothetical protein